VDEIAERILTLGYTPLHSYSDYTRIATVKEAKDISDGKQAVEKVVEGFQALVQVEREILSLSQETGDEGSSALMSDYIRQQEKQLWMYSAYLK